MNARFVVVLLFALSSADASAQNATTADKLEERFDVAIRLFVRDGEQGSEEVQKLLRERSKTQGVQLSVMDVSLSGNKEYMESVLKDYKVTAASTPVVVGCNRVIYGYDKSFNDRLDEMLRLDVFVTKGSPECDKASEYLLNTFRKRYPHFGIRSFNINEDKVAHDWLKGAAEKTQQEFRTPSIYVCGELSTLDSVESLQVQLDKMLRKWTPVRDGKPDSRNISAE